MENAKKNLKTFSILVLVLAAYALVMLVLNAIKLGSTPVDVPDGTPQIAVDIAKYIAIGVSGLMLLPRVYIGVKGLKIANDPENAGKAHIIWAVILLVFSVLALISPLTELFKGGDILVKIGDLAMAVLEAAAFLGYLDSARRVAKGE